MFFKKGITLIEMLVIIAVLGIFSAIGYVNFNSIDSGSSLNRNKQILVNYLEEIKFKAFSDGKHYKVILVNSGDDVEINLYEPDAANVKWRDLDLNRRCNCQSGDSSDDTCDNSFSNAAVASLTAVSNFTKTLEDSSIKNCNNGSCGDETNPPIEICYLYDGSSPQDKFFKLVGKDNLNIIFRLNKTGHVED